MSIKPSIRAVLGCTVVFGVLALPGRHASFVGLSAITVLAPVQKALARAAGLVSRLGEDLASIRSAGAEKRRLRDEIVSLKERLQTELARSAEKDERLRMLSEFAPYREGLVARQAEIIGQGAGAQRDLLFIDKGSNDGIEKGMTVVAGSSIVGTVRAVAHAVSSVLLITSPASKFHGQLTSTGESGIVVGTGDGAMRMKYISLQQPRPDDGVVSRGRDAPKHFLIGTVVSARPEPGTLTYDVILRPARDLDRLTTVIAVRPAASAADLFRHNGGDE